MKDEKLVKKIVEDTLKSYEIPPQCVLSSRYDEPSDTVIFVTNGGKKISHKVGEAIERKLTEVEMSGVLPQEELLWSKKLNQGIKQSELQKK
jgi:hypothetical protein